ncbi:MAG: F0F1 ATP synthase subunit B [Elusimicrobia bacterium]|nr:F0F1 ATP synthase subunit B [Elusimicrobiota bacterium]
MEALVKPEFGLMFWTILIFLLLVYILSKFAWRPLISALEERENNLRLERETAEKARTEAERIRQELESKLAYLKGEARRRLEEARMEGIKEKESIMAEARTGADLMLEKARKELEEEKNRLVIQLRKDAAELSIMVAEKIINKAVDSKIQKEVIDGFLTELETISGKK